MTTNTQAARAAPSPQADNAGTASQRFTRVTAIVIALEHYRTPSSGDPLPTVAFAHADADAFAGLLRDIFKEMRSDDVIIRELKDEDASLAALRDELGYTIKNLAEDELFILYYAGHGFHGAGGNRLSAYDTNHFNVGETSLHMRDDLLEPLAQSKCQQALVFVDACAEKFRDVVGSRDVISDLNAEEVQNFLDGGWYCGVFLSCSPGEKSYPAIKFGHGVWTHYLLEAMSGRAARALMADRWLTDYGLRDYLRSEVPQFITRDMQVRGTQTPQAILSGSNSFRIRHIPQPPAVPTDAALAGIKLRNNGEYLEAIETGPIRRLDGFNRNIHTVPTQVTDAVEKWCHRLLSTRVADELQHLYGRARVAFNARRKDLTKEERDGSGNLDAPAFRYSIETGQNPEAPAEYAICRRLKLRQGWLAHRAAIETLFGKDFDRFVIELEEMDDTFDSLVERLEDIKEAHGGKVDDDDREQRATYKRDGATFTFDLNKRRLEISFAKFRSLDIVDAVHRLQLGVDRQSPMLPAPAQLDPTVGRPTMPRGES